MAAVWSAVRHATAVTAAPLGPATWTDIETEPVPAPLPAIAHEPVAEDSPVIPVRALASTAPRPPEAAPRVTPEAPHGAVSTDRDDAPWTLSTTTTPATPSLGPLVGSQVGDAVRAGIAATVAQSAERKRPPRALEGLHARDLDLGLVPGGELVTIAREATHRSLVPTNSRGVLEFETDERGAVTSGRVIDASSGNAEWEALAIEVVRLAQGKTLAPGVVATLQVVSALKNIDGVTQTGKAPSVLDKLGAIAGAITDPLGTIAARSVPPLRVVSARIVDVRSR